MALSAGGQFVAVACGPRISIWDVTRRRLVATLAGTKARANSVAFSGDGHFLVSGAADGTVCVRDATNFSTVRTWRDGDHVSRTVVADAAEWVAVCGATTGSTEVHLYRLKTGQRFAGLSGFVAPVEVMCLSPNGRTIAAGKTTGDLSRRDARTRRLLGRLEHGNENVIQAMAFSRDSTLIATAGWDRSVRLYDAHTGREVAVLRGHHQPALAVAFSRDGSTLASGAGDGVIKLWDIAAKRELMTMRGHLDAVSCLASGPDDRFLLSGSSDKSVRIWEAPRRTDR